MSDFSQGPGWWQASDGKWYPPEQAPGGAAAPTPAQSGPGMSPYGPLAEWPIRAASYVIDFMAVGVIAQIVSQISSTLGFLISLIGFAFGLYNAYLNGSTGQSIGKRVMGTKVVSETDGSLIGGGMGIVRYFAHIVDALACCIGYLWPIWDDKRQTFSDKIMKTVVISGLERKSLGDALQG